MTITAASIMAKARLQLIDTGTQPRWTDAELMGYISDAQSTMVAISPSLSAKRTTVQLAIGVQQTIPADGYTLLDVTRNMGLSGTTPGRAVRIIPRELLDAHRPSWYADPSSPTVQNFIYDPADQDRFMVYPASTGGYVDLLYSQVPPAIVATSTPLVVPDIYETAVLYYTLFRAHSKDNDFASAAQAANWLTLFTNFMGAGRSGDLAESPNQQLSAPDLTTRGAAK